jgi:hypothetical protein
MMCTIIILNINKQTINDYLRIFHNHKNIIIRIILMKNDNNIILDKQKHNVAKTC